MSSLSAVIAAVVVAYYFFYLFDIVVTRAVDVALAVIVVALLFQMLRTQRFVDCYCCDSQSNEIAR